MVMRWYETLSFVSTFVLSSSYYKVLPVLLITTVGLFSDVLCPLEAAIPMLRDGYYSFPLGGKAMVVLTGDSQGSILFHPLKPRILPSNKCTVVCLKGTFS